MTAMGRYQPVPPAPVDLSDNTNLWGTPPAAQAVLASAGRASVSRYPSVYGDPLKAAAARYIGVSPDQVITGCGSDDVLDVAIRSSAAPGESFAFCAPTFSMIPFIGELNRLENRPIPFRPDWEIDVDELVSSGAPLTYICAPNNPTATGVSRQAIEAVVDRSRGLVIVDEAYAEYAGMTAVDLVARSDRLLVTRTLSKAFGLAGLRVGYGIGSPGLVARLELARGPYKVASISELAAAAALDHDRDWVMQRVAETRAVRARFEAAVVAATSWELLPSVANFVLARPATGTQDSVAALDARLRRRGIAGRPIDGLPWGRAMRLTIGPWELMAPVVEIMAEEDSR